MPTSLRPFSASLLFLAAALAFVLLAPTGDAQTQCNSPFHGTGVQVLTDNPTCGQGSAGRDIVRVGARTSGSSLVTSVEFNVPFNQQNVMTTTQVPAATYYIVFLGVGTDTTAEIGECYAANMATATGVTNTWTGGGPTSYTNPLWNQPSCNSAGLLSSVGTATMTWPSYKNAGATGNPYYCNELDVAFPLSAIGASTGSGISYGVATAEENLLYRYAARSNDGAADVDTNEVWTFGTYGVGNTGPFLPPNVNSFASSASGTTATLTWTQGSDNFAQPPYGYYIFEGATLLTTTAVPLATTTYGITGLAPGSTHTYTIKEANCRGESSGITTTVTVPVPPPSCSASPASVAAGVATTFTATGGTPPTPGPRRVALQVAAAGRRSPCPTPRPARRR